MRGRTAAVGLLLLGCFVAADAAAQPEESSQPAQPAEERPIPPRLLEGVSVELPEDSPPLPEGAAVDLLVDVDAEGNVTAAEVLFPLRDDVDALALEAARRLRFEPARMGGQPVASRVRFRLVLTTPDEPEAVPEPGPEGEPGAAPEPSVEEEPIPQAETEAERAAGYETVVVGSLIPPERGAASRMVLQGAELTTIPGTFGEPLRVVATLPGVARSPFGLGYFLVRGASFENTGFLVDGYRVPILYHLFAGPAVISSRLVERLDFYPGGYPVAHGRFTAGLISLQTAPPPADRVHVEAEVDLFRAGAMAVVPLGDGDGSVAGAFRRSYYDLLLPVITEDLDLAYSDFQLRMDHRVGRDADASLFVFGSEDSIDVSQAAGSGEAAATTETGFSYSFLRAIGSLRWRVGQGATLSWSGMLGRDWTDIQSREPGRPELGLQIVGTYLGERLEAVLPGSRDLQTKVGVDVMATEYSLTASFPTPLGLGEHPRPDFDPEVLDLGGETLLVAAGFYVEQTLQSGPVELTPGLRTEVFRYGDVSTVEPDPRGVVRVRVTDDVTVKAATGLFVQPPEPLTLDRSLGNPKLRPYRSWQSSTGVEVVLPASVEVQPTLFYSSMWQLERASGEIVVDDEGNVTREILVDDGRGRAYGAELLVRRRVSEGLFGWLSYTLARSERFLTGGDVQPFMFDQTHTLSLAASYLVGPWRFGARFTLATGRPTQVVTGAVYDADADRYAPERSGLVARLPTYHQLDVRVDREFGMGPLDCGAYLDVMNVYNASNAEGRIYQYDFARSTNLPGIPILPTLGLRCELD